MWPGLLFVAHGLHGVFAAGARARRLERHPDRPWLADYRETFLILVYSRV